MKISAGGEEMIDKRLIFCKLKARDFNDVVRELGSKMEKYDFVKSSYIDAVIEREQKFPTGLEMGEYGVAIPHADQRHVNKSVVAVASLEKPIGVSSMINPSKKIRVGLVFLLAVREPEKQVKILSKLMAIFQDIDLLNKIEDSDSSDEIFSYVESLNLVKL